MAFLNDPVPQNSQYHIFHFSTYHNIKNELLVQYFHLKYVFQFGPHILSLSLSLPTLLCVCVCVCVCERERERERDMVIFLALNKGLLSE